MEVGKGEGWRNFGMTKSMQQRILDGLGPVGTCDDIDQAFIAN